MMACYQGMRRGFCSVTASSGVGVGYAALLIRLKPAPSAADRMRDWLTADVLARLASRAGIGSSHLLESAVMPQMTNEQRIRGADAGFAWALFVTGYDVEALAEIWAADLGARHLAEQGAMDVQGATYRVDYSLSHREVET